MPHIRISDELYEEVQSRAAEAGFANVDAYVADLLKLEFELEDEVGDLDDFFTPERLALLDEARAAISRGELHTLEELDAELEKQKAEWVRQKQVEKK